MKNNTRFIVLCLVGLAAWFVQAMTFVDLVHPDEVLLDDRPSDRVAVAADGTVTLAGGEASFIRLKWKTAFPKQTKVVHRLCALHTIFCQEKKFDLWCEHSWWTLHQCYFWRGQCVEKHCVLRYWFPRLRSH